MVYPVVNRLSAGNLWSPQPLQLGVRPIIGQALPKLPPDLTEEQVYRMAGQTMVATGNKLAAKMNQTYEQYKDVGSWWLGEAATAFFVAGPVGPLFAAADLWWQSSRNNEAVTALEASRKLGQDWVNQMADEGGWLPTYIDGIQRADPALGDQVSFAFDKVVAELNRVNTVLQDVRTLPPQVLSQFISTVWGSVKNDLTTSANFLNDLALTLRQLLGAVADLTKAGRAATEAAPLLALLAGLGIVLAVTLG